MSPAPAPVLLSPNQPPRPYRGGAGIADLRGVPAADGYRSEDFVGSATTIAGDDEVGLSRLPDGRVLRDAIAADPVGFLGAEHVARFGAQPELLVKLLDTAERLFVHLHPDDGFARRHLGLVHGKTEAWVVVATRDTDDPRGSGHAHLGFRRPVTAAEVGVWVHGQRVDDMLDAMHRVQLAAGDAILVPGGLPHSIGAGVTVVEVQQPSDLSILLEYDGFPGLGREQAFLGLDEATALDALDRAAVSPGRLGELVAGGVARPGRRGVTRVLPPGADPFFRVELVELVGGVGGGGGLRLDAGYSVLVVLDGRGVLRTWTGEVELTRGATVLVPHGAGCLELAGELRALRCRPPE